MPAEVTVTLNRAQLAQLLQSTDGPLARELALIGNEIATIAKLLVPVDTGRLRASIVWQLGTDGQGLFVEIGTNVEYAAHVEFGTRYMRAQPYLVPALIATMTRLGVPVNI